MMLVMVLSMWGEGGGGGGGGGKNYLDIVGRLVGQDVSCGSLARVPGQ